MKHTYVNGDLVGFMVEATEGAVRNGGIKHHPAVYPTRLVTRIMSDGLVLRDLGEKKWQGAKGGEEFHRTFLSIINYLVGQDNHGVILYYEGGNRGTTARTRPPIMDFDPLPDTAGARLQVMSEFVGDWGPHYGSKETFTYAQTVPMLNWLATIVSRDPEMRDLILNPPPRVRRIIRRGN